jgi:RHS repeat-associated protein
LQLTSQTATKGSTLMNLTYSYAATDLQSGAGTSAGNSAQLMSISGTINGQNRAQAFTYDNVGRLVTANGWSAWGRRFAYDRWGNRTGMWNAVAGGSQLQNIAIALTGGSSNNRIANVNGVTYTYDGGNCTADGAHTYVYDAENRQVSVDAGATSTSGYDANNWRIKKFAGGVTTHYVWEGAKVIAEYNGSTGALMSEYVYASGKMIREQGSAIRYYIADRLSTRLITDGTGAVVGTMDHLPFGEDTLTGTGESEKRRFTTYERDSESGTDHAINRQHQFANGRFMQADPVHGSIASPQALNRYSYTGNDPINWVDPLGLEKCFDAEGNEVSCDTPGAIAGSDDNDDPVYLWGWAFDGMPGFVDWGNIGLLLDGGWGLIGAGWNMIAGGAPTITDLAAIRKAICATIPSGRTIGVSGGVGAVGSIIGGGEIVMNYDSGQVSAFGFGGTQIGWNGAASASVYSGAIYGLEADNSNYSKGFTGGNVSLPIGGGVVGIGAFAGGSSGGFTGGAKGLIPGGPVVVGLSAGVSAAYGVGGGTVTHYSKPVQLGKLWPFALNPTDALLFTARQLCK